MDQPEEAPPWEQVRPSEWLCLPYFRDNNPDWIIELKSIVAEGLRDKQREEVELTQTQIEGLALILARFIKGHEDWGGWVSKGDRESLQSVQTHACGLYDALSNLKRAKDGPDRSSDWYLDALLKNRFDFASVDQLIDLLDFLRNFEIRSPVFADEQRHKQPFLSPKQDALRAHLQDEIDEWWTRVTGLSIAKAAYKA